MRQPRRAQRNGDGIALTFSSADLVLMDKALAAVRATPTLNYDDEQRAVMEATHEKLQVARAREQDEARIFLSPQQGEALLEADEMIAAVGANRFFCQEFRQKPALRTSWTRMSRILRDSFGSEWRAWWERMSNPASVGR